MQNENAGKTIATLAAEKYPINADMIGTISEDVAEYERRAWQDGFNHAQQSQPMWREIKADKEYEKVVVRDDSINEISTIERQDGQQIIDWGYTHYLTSDDLLKLPTEKK